MSRVAFTILWIALASGLLVFMAIAWRARKRRDAGYALPSDMLRGETLAHFAKVAYVSTTPAGAPFERIAIPGLSYKGWAEVTVQADGVAIEVAGERRVEITRQQITGAGSAGGRAGKIVERDGLALIAWVAAEGSGATRELESSFRFDSPAEQHRFADAVSALAIQNNQEFTQPNHTSQEDS